MKKMLLPLFVLSLGSTQLHAQSTIISQPTNQVVANGRTAVFGVTAANSGPFTYQWMFNSNNISPFITTVAGNGSPGYSGDGGTATNAMLFYPRVVVLDSYGNLFILDSQNRVRKVDTNGIITTVAGGGPGGGTDGLGDGSAATNATLSSPNGLTLDASGNLFIADSGHSLIRKVDTNGIITKVAGNALNGAFSGDGGLAKYANLYSPTGLAEDGYGNLFIADTFNRRIRKVDTNSIITTVVGNGTFGFSGDGGAATNASLNYAEGVAVDKYGELLIVDDGNNRIRKVDTNGIITTVAGNGTPGFSGDGGSATNAQLNDPYYGVVVDSFGNLFIADTHNNRVRKVDTNGIITTLVGNGSLGYSGDGNVATNAMLDFPSSVALDNLGNLFVADLSNHRIRKVYQYGSSPTLVLPNAGIANAGNYSVVVNSPDGSITSSVASLVVLLPPQGFTGLATITKSNAQIALQFTGTPNYPYTLLSATNLSPPVNWQPILTNPADANGKWNFPITNLSGVPAGFFRAVGQ